MTDQPFWVSFSLASSSSLPGSMRGSGVIFTYRAWERITGIEERHFSIIHLPKVLSLVEIPCGRISLVNVGCLWIGHNVVSIDYCNGYGQTDEKPWFSGRVKSSFSLV